MRILPMPSVKLRFSPITMFPWWKALLVLPLIVLALLFQQGCCSQVECLRPTLQLVEHPAMREVQLVPKEQGDYGITDRARKDILINLGSYYYSLEECNAVIREYNKTVTER